MAVKTIANLRDERNKLVNELNVVKKKVADNNGEWTPEWRSEYDKVGAAAKVAIQALKTAQEDDKRNSDFEDLLNEDDDDVEGGRRTKNTQRRSDNRIAAAWNPQTSDRKIREGSLHNRIFQYDPANPYTWQQDGYHDSFSKMLSGRNRGGVGLVMPEGPNAALRSDSEQDGGYFVASEEFMSGIMKNVDDIVHIQRNSRVFMVDGYRNLGIRKRLQKANSFTKGQELSDITTSFDQSLKWGKRYLTPHYFVGGIQISNDLLRNGFINVEGMVREELMINMQEYLEQQYLYGNGDQGPLGIMVAHADGLPSSRDSAAIDADVNTGAGEDSTTHFGFNSLMRAKYSLKPQYRNSARWMFHTDALLRMATIKDGENRPLWMPSVRNGEPERVLGLPFDENLWMPHTPGAGLYYGILANWEYFWIAWGMQLEARRLVEIAARTNQTEYHFRGKVDAACMKDEAFTRLAYAPS